MKLLRLALAVILLACLTRTLPAFECNGIATSPGEEITAELVVSGITSPVDIQAAPGDSSRLYVVEQRGRIRIINLVNDTLLSSPFLDITSRVRSGGERGLLGLAFHPDFQQNRYFFVNYTNSSGTSVIARYRASSPTSTNTNTQTILLNVSQPYSNHNGGQIAFSPRDNYLYIGFGDGGSGGDPGNRSQNGRQLLGKMLRIDVDSGEPYGIPADNPFTNNGSVRDEVWALGLRNPWRFSFDPETHDLYIGDVGQNAWEEIDFQAATSRGGENYEWKVREGNHSYSNTAYGFGERTGALYDYSHSGAGSGCSVTGGVVYRGCSMPDLRGVYFFAEYCTNWVRTLRYQNGTAREVINRTSDLNRGIAGSLRQISTFGLDGNGEVYIADLSAGRIYRVIPVNPPDNPPNARIVSTPDPGVVQLENGFALVILDASSSDNGEGGNEDLGFQWQKISGPDGDNIGRPNKESTAINFTQAGDYTYEVTVSDGNGQDTARANITVEGAPEDVFRRGDSNGDSKVDLSDGIHILSILFIGFAGPDCIDASDSNNDGSLDLTDGIVVFNYLFLGGNAPALPGPINCGPDIGGEDDLDCGDYSACN